MTIWHDFARVPPRHRFTRKWANRLVLRCRHATAFCNGVTLRAGFCNCGLCICGLVCPFDKMLHL